MKIVDYEEWKIVRRGLTRAQAMLAGSRGHRRTHRKRSPEERRALRRGMVAGVKSSEKSGRMVWTGPRTVRLR